MPTSITSDATITIENSLDAGPNYPDQNRPVIVLAVVAWVTYILRQLLQFTTSTLGLFEDDFTSIRNRLAELEGESSDTDEDAPTSSKRPPGTTTTTKPSSKAPGTKKCNRCGASGHDTTDCRTRNPEMVKKRIANNKKAKKEADRLRSYPPPYAAHRIPPSRHYFDLLDYAEYPAPQPPPRQGPTTRSMLAVHKDAEEFRRRQAQSARDRRKGKSRDTS